MPRLSPLYASDARWKGIYKAGGISILAMLVIMVVQMVVFIAWPPPPTVEGFFSLFRQNWFFGLLSMDLLYILNNTLLILIYLALYFSSGAMVDQPCSSHLCWD